MPSWRRRLDFPISPLIAGATKPEQIAANVKAIAWQPSETDLAELDRIAPTPRR